jgi:hypothetical protein
MYAEPFDGLRALASNGLEPGGSQHCSSALLGPSLGPGDSSDE